jgi:hypothetical protein
MDKQSETTDCQPKRRGFFDRPAGVDFWMNVGGRFWGGLLIGIGFGLFIGAMLVKDELVPLNSALWVISWLVLYSIGLAITQRAVRRSASSNSRESGSVTSSEAIAKL